MSDSAERASSPGLRLRFGSWLTRPAGVFWVFLAIYLLTWAGHYTSGDGAIKVDWARGLLFRHSSKLDPAIGGALEYSIYGIGHSLLAILPLALSGLVRNLTGIRCEAALYTLIFVVNGAVFLYLVARYLWPLHSPQRVWATVCLMGLATFWWPYTKLDFTEPLVLTVLFGAFLLLRAGRPLAGMLAAGLAGTLRPDALLFAGLLGVWHLWRTRQWRDIQVMAFGVVPALVLMAVGNQMRWHTFRSQGYAGFGFDYPFLAGLHGILLSPGKGLLWFSPPLLLGLMGWRKFRAAAPTRHDAGLFLAVFIVSVGLYSRWWDWGSDDAWGVRFMVPAVMLLTIPAIEVLDHRRLSATIFGLGVAVQLLGVIVPPLEYVVMIRGGAESRPAPYGATGMKQIDLEEMWFHPRFCQIHGHWVLLRVLFGMPPAPQSVQAERNTGRGLYECFPPQVWVQHATPDFIWWPKPGQPGNRVSDPAPRVP